MRFVLIFSLFFAFKFEANDQLGLPVLATEAEIKKLQNKRSKVLSTSVARRVTKIVESLDEIGQLEEAKELLLKDKKNAEAKEKDREIARVVKDAESELKELEKRKESMKSYDRSMLFYYQAYINLSFKDNLNGARRNYLDLVQEKDATARIKLAAYYTLAQLYLSDEDFNNGIKYLFTWFKTTDQPTAQAYVLLGQAYYLQDEFKKSFNVMNEAKRLADETNTTFRENWFSILLAVMDELKMKEQQIPVYEEVLNLYPKKKYFVNLAGLYNSLDRPEDYTSLLKTAYQKELLDKKAEFQSLSQMLLASGNPYWAAEVILTGLSSTPGLQVVDQECSMSKVLDDEGNIVKDNKGIPVEEEVCIDVMGPAFVKPGSSAALDQDADPVLEEDERNLTILAEALRAAKERKEAIKIFEKLAKITDDGEAFIAMGNLYYLDNEIDKAIDVIEKGLKRGKLKNPEYAQLTLGQALFELERFDEAREVFTTASQSDKDSIKKSARAWLKYTDTEQERVNNLKQRALSLT